MGFAKKIAAIILGVVVATVLTGCKDNAYVQFKPRVGDSYTITYDNSLKYVEKNKELMSADYNIQGKYSVDSIDESGIKSQLDIKDFYFNSENGKKKVRISKTSYDTLSIYKQIVGISSQIELDKEGKFIACTANETEDYNQYINIEQLVQYFSEVMSGFNKKTLVEGVEFDNSLDSINGEINEQLSEFGIQNSGFTFKERVDSVTSNWATLKMNGECKLDQSTIDIDATMIVNVRKGICTQCSFTLIYDNIKMPLVSKGDSGTLTMKSNLKFK